MKSHQIMPKPASSTSSIDIPLASRAGSSQRKAKRPRLVIHVPYIPPEEKNKYIKWPWPSETTQSAGVLEPTGKPKRKGLTIKTNLKHHSERNARVSQYPSISHDDKQDYISSDSSEEEVPLSKSARIGVRKGSVDHEDSIKDVEQGTWRRGKGRDLSSSPFVPLSSLGEKRRRGHTMSNKAQSLTKRKLGSARKNLPVSEEDGDDDVDELDSFQPPKRTHGRKFRRRSLSSSPTASPASEEVSESDDKEGRKLDDSVLTDHRPFCEKCLRPPTSSLVVQHAAKRKRGGRKKKKLEEEEEEEMSGDELFDFLGGWVSCKGCVVASHFGCLGAAQKKAAVDHLREQDTLTGIRVPNGKKRHVVYPEEEAEFLCGRCTEGIRCFVCWKEHLPGDKAAEDEAKKLESVSAEGSGMGFKSQPTVSVPALGEAPVPVVPTDQVFMSDTEPQLHSQPATDRMDFEPQPPQADGESKTMDVDFPNIGLEPRALTTEPELSEKVGAEVLALETEATRPEPVRPPRILFRCLRCRLAAHYEHLRLPKSLGPDPGLLRIADHYQATTEDGTAWHCHVCSGMPWAVDMIIAWRPLPDSPIPYPAPTPSQPWKFSLPREYLVKFMHRPMRHLSWVPHIWLQALAPQKLRKFLEKGPVLDVITDESLAAAAALEEEGESSAAVTIGGVLGVKRQTGRVEVGPEEDAESCLPVLWSTVDRVLEVKLLRPDKVKTDKGKGKQLRGHRVLSVSLSASDIGGQKDSTLPSPTRTETPVATATKTPFELLQEKLDLPDGISPSKKDLVEIEEWESLTRRKLDSDDVDEVAGLVGWCFVKWEDLQYDQACWDTPPPTSSPLYPAFKKALARFLHARHIKIPVLSAAQAKARDSAASKGFLPPQEQPECIVGGKLMPFQMEGLQWLLYKHFKRESCILADDMGLGKTVQIASVLGYLGSDEHKVYPCLVVVPNSTITNWVREFEKWCPHLRVVPYYGEAAARKIILKHELFHKGMQGKAEGLKAHIVLTTYDMITGSEFRVFSSIPRWEVLCVDEGQRLKSDNSKIFSNLKNINSVHRILLTGTPLNNNIRELFNLLNFLDEKNFSDLEAMEQEYVKVDESNIQQLHEMIRPYILRRIKADVLKLPPKVEIIIPLTLTPLQKQVYKGVFEKSADVIREILKARQRRLKAKKTAKVAEIAGEEHREGEKGVQEEGRKGKQEEDQEGDQKSKRTEEQNEAQK